MLKAEYNTLHCIDWVLGRMDNGLVADFGNNIVKNFNRLLNEDTSEWTDEWNTLKMN